MLPSVCLYAIRNKAWIDEFMMNLLTEKCLYQWNKLPPNTVPPLAVDSF